MTINYEIVDSLSSEQFVDLLRRSTLAERRPIDDLGRIELMLEHADVVVAAYDEGMLVGVARSVSDFGFCTYLSDLAVAESHQRKGIGVELIRRTKLAAPEATLILLSAPAAMQYYPRIGMTRHDGAFVLSDPDKLSA